MWLSLTLSSVMSGKGNQLKTVVGVDYSVAIKRASLQLNNSFGIGGGNHECSQSEQKQVGKKPMGGQHGNSFGFGISWWYWPWQTEAELSTTESCSLGF